MAATGGRFSAQLGIRLASRDSAEIFKWFLAAVLFGARIPEVIAARTYREFEKEGLLTPDRIVRLGWNGLVKALDEGGYVRYDFKTATKLLDICRALLKDWAGDLNALHGAATDSGDLERKLKALGKGIGTVTANIFLRELRSIWPKAEPLPSELVLAGAMELGLIPKRLKDKGRALVTLRDRWTREGNRPADFPEFEAALLRFGLSIRRKAARGPARMAPRSVGRAGLPMEMVGPLLSETPAGN